MYPVVEIVIVNINKMFLLRKSMRAREIVNQLASADVFSDDCLVVKIFHRVLGKLVLDNGLLLITWFPFPSNDADPYYIYFYDKKFVDNSCQ